MEQSMERPVGGLVMTRKKGDVLYVFVKDEELKITVTEIGSHRMKLRIEADKDSVIVLRAESNDIEKRLTELRRK